MNLSKIKGKLNNISIIADQDMLMGIALRLDVPGIVRELAEAEKSWLTLKEENEKLKSRNIELLSQLRDLTQYTLGKLETIRYLRKTVRNLQEKESGDIGRLRK